MAGIYGDILLAFPEQFRTITVYQQTAKINGGWDKATGSEKTVLGVFQHTKARSLKDSNGNLATSGGLELWTATADLDGFFTQTEGTVYRINGSNNWDFEGGFYRYNLDKVIGNNGTESSDTTWNFGGDNFD